MLTIIIICFCCYILYKCDVVTNFLNGFIIPGDEEPAAVIAGSDVQKTPRPAAVSADVNEEPLETLTDREKLEKRAAVVVAAMGEDPRTVVYMSEGLMQALVNDYIKCNK